MERKSSLAANAIDGRTVTGLAAVFGNVDDTGDRLCPGAFTQTLRDMSRRVCFLWQHDLSAPPIAAIKAVREIGREELPKDVLSEYPDASGGLVVVRTYLDTPQADAVLAGIKAKAITGMSFGFDPIRFDYQRLDRRQVRNLRAVKLWEISDTPMPANPATRAIKTLNAGVLLRLAIAERDSYVVGRGITDER